MSAVFMAVRRISYGNVQLRSVQDPTASFRQLWVSSLAMMVIALVLAGNLALAGLFSLVAVAFD